MSFGNEIINLRKERNLTQDAFGQLLHVTRQTVSSWENGKSYPDLQTLIAISNHFSVSLDSLLKGDKTMVQKMDKNLFLGAMKKEKSHIGFFTGAGTGLILSCLYSPDSIKKIIVIIIGVIMTGIGWYKGAALNSRVEKYLTDEDQAKTSFHD